MNKVSLFYIGASSCVVYHSCHCGSPRVELGVAGGRLQGSAVEIFSWQCHHFCRCKGICPWTTSVTYDLSSPLCPPPPQHQTKSACRVLTLPFSSTGWKADLITVCPEQSGGGRWRSRRRDSSTPAHLFFFLSPLPLPLPLSLLPLPPPSPFPHITELVF